jgi:phosphoglycerate dehydrogenase-like enzyme
MRVVAWSSNLTEERCREVDVELVDKATFFSISDIVTVHIRLSPRTYHLIGREDFSRMKQGPLPIEAVQPVRDCRCG